MANHTRATDLCYLCGKSIADGPSTRDHAVPRVLSRGKKPKVAGFDYGGKLPTHPKCDNRFLDEQYVLKALDLVAVFHDPGPVVHLPGNTSVRFAAINSEKLPGFTQRDLRFCEINDARDDHTRRISHIRTAVPGNPLRRALFVSLAVLGKSAAVLLLARHHLRAVPEEWNAVALPYAADAPPLISPTSLVTSARSPPGSKSAWQI
ncbi:MAG: hypothetical protein OXH52_01305 [Gammaproteobacteria bacterium]|nr:hypothetical protein [Gammaproteobacteria bacterium]